MCKESYTVEDFVLDPEFQKWVLKPNKASNTHWDDFLKQHPHFREDIALARNIVINMSRKSLKVSEEQIADTWQNIKSEAGSTHFAEKETSVIPLNFESTLSKSSKVINYPDSSNAQHHFYRLVAILIITFGLAITFNLYFNAAPPPIAEIIPELFMEYHIAPPGVKSSFKLPDGSQVMLNAGSSLSFIRGFEEHQRFIELEGEAFFNVAKDEYRPFKVKSGETVTTALGTSFNIKAYQESSMDISLISGKVEVLVSAEDHQMFELEKGQGIRLLPGSKEAKVVEFDEDLILAWTRKTLVFKNTPIRQIKNVLENWYGVKITFTNSPKSDLEISGRFVDQNLENVLIGLSHSARFEFEIKDDKVYLTFNP